jgi:hypothetical protein
MWFSMQQQCRKTSNLGKGALMTIVMGRLIAESSQRVLVEPCGTFNDYYDAPDEDMRKWIGKNKIVTINDEYVENYQLWLNTEDPVELMVSEHTAARLL